MNCKNCGACCKSFKSMIVFKHEIPQNYLELFDVLGNLGNLLNISVKEGNSGCPLYKENEGCMLGEERPLVCKMYPIVLLLSGTNLQKLYYAFDLIQASYFAMSNLNCQTEDYVHRFGRYLLQEKHLSLVSCEKFYTIKKRDLNKIIQYIVEFILNCEKYKFNINVKAMNTPHLILFACLNESVKYAIDVETFFLVKKKEPNFLGFLIELYKYINIFEDRDFIGDFLSFLGFDDYKKGSLYSIWDDFRITEYCVNNKSLLDNMFEIIKECNLKNKSFNLIKLGLNKLDYIISKKENKVPENDSINNNDEDNDTELIENFNKNEDNNISETNVMVADINENTDLIEKIEDHQIESSNQIDTDTNNNQVESNLTNQFERNGCFVREHERTLKSGYKTIVKEHDRNGSIVNKLITNSNLINIGIIDSEKNNTPITKTLEQSIVAEMEEQNTKLKKLRMIIRKNHPEIPKVIPNSALELSDQEIQQQEEDCALANTKKIDNLLKEMEITPEIEYIRHKINVDAKTRNMNRTEPANKTFIINKPKRDKKLADFVKKEANGFCECCDNLSFITINGEYALQAYRINNLANDGKDEYFNIIAVCPMCEAKLIYSADKEKWKEYAQKKILMKRYGDNPPKVEDLGL